MVGLSAVDLLRFVTNVLYLLVFLVSIANAVRRRYRAEIDVALLFGATGLLISASWITSALGIQPGQLLVAVEVSLVMALPYLLLRLVEDFASVPRPLVLAAEAGLALAVVASFVQSPPYPPWLAGTEIVYFAVLEIYCAVAFVRAARQSRGVTLRRMQAAASGSLFLGLAVLAAGVQLALPGAAALWTIVGQLCSLMSGIAYFVGFAPPGWLRRAWQAPDLQGWLRRSSELVRLPDLASAVREMEHDCATALGTSQAAIGLWDSASNSLSFDLDQQMSSYPITQTISGQVLVAQKARFIPDLSAANPSLADLYHSRDAKAALMAPITAGERRFGVVAVYARRAPFFAADDVELIQLLADQMSVILENRALVEETARERARAEALAAVDQLNAELETRIGERTSELQEALAELEAFSYSVSHDLRAPLRTIDGFVQAFVKDFGRQISPTGQDYLDRIRAASQRMGLLIDGLLRLSRVTRSEMRRDVVDLSALARGIVSDLRKRAPERVVAVDVADGLIARGDEQLLRIVLENLLENAWKFTGHRGDARIEFGVTSIDGGLVYVVRDNGAGFDMDYADKLFVPFERLHGRQEFEGTGIGLATVRRIIGRHGGKIWGEGKPESGATFYFTLGRESMMGREGSRRGTIWESAGHQAHLVGGG